MISQKNKSKYTGHGHISRYASKMTARASTEINCQQFDHSSRNFAREIRLIKKCEVK